MFQIPTPKSLRMAGALLSLLSGLLLCAAPALAQREDWAVCAVEGQTCRIGNAEAMVRFGTDGRYAFRVTRGQQACTVDAFGSDPTPGVRKRCEVSVNWRQQERYRDWQERRSERGGWTWCGNEGDLCRVPGSAQVRYGANGRYAERSVDQSIPCHNGAFGDPAEGVAKQCFYRRGPSESGGPGPGQAAYGGYGGGDSSGGGGGLPWAVCAHEGDSCNFRGGGMLRYGANGRYVYREAYNGLQCNNDAFGVDPAPGGFKRCEILRLR